MTHYAAYKGNNKVKGIIHIHHAKLWHKYINTLPTTNFKTEYGTEEIANEVEAFSIKGHKIIIMAGHKDGILILGESLEDAGMAYLELIKNL
jgi:ribulose-5-phosphate 4-epimerase/fuculose-1-phosphate aldolase